MGLLLSAISQPLATFDGAPLHSSLHEMAAAYLYHIVCNHPFIDGNKRTGAVCALVFLYVNGWQVNAEVDDFELLVWAVARGEADKRAIMEFLMAHSEPASNQT